MQASLQSGWSAEYVTAAGQLASLRELNLRFLDLAAAGGDSPARRAADLPPAARAAAADCPYALFDVRFHDEGHWNRRLQSPAGWRVADEPAASAAAVEFVALALFYAWHVAGTAPLRAQLQLGMRERTVAAFARLTLNCLPDLAATQAAYLGARWQHCAAYWDALLAAAASRRSHELRRVQLYGIQLAAAARLA